MIDTDYKYAQWSMNVNPYGMHWQTYHNGCWYDKNIMSYDEAVEQIIKPEVIAKVMKDHPHLTAFDLNNNQVIDYRNDVRSIPNNPLPNNNDITVEHFIPSKSIDTSIPLKTFNLKDVPEKINKGTIEEQIEACTNLDELKTFKYVAEMNSKLNLLFHGKENELALKKML